MAKIIQFHNKENVESYIFITKEKDGQIYAQAQVKGKEMLPIDMEAVDLDELLRMIRMTAKYLHSLKSKKEQIETMLHHNKLKIL